MARMSTSSSAWASPVKLMRFSRISCADSSRLTAWSLMRSRSPMPCSMRVASRVSSTDRPRLVSLTRKVPSTSS